MTWLKMSLQEYFFKLVTMFLIINTLARHGLQQVVYNGSHIRMIYVNIVISFLKLLKDFLARTLVCLPKLEAHLYLQG